MDIFASERWSRSKSSVENRPARSCKNLRHLRLNDLLNDRLQERPKSIFVARQHRFPVGLGRRSLVLGNGMFPFPRGQ
jgi:hypothetical protein